MLIYMDEADMKIILIFIGIVVIAYNDYTVSNLNTTVVNPVTGYACTEVFCSDGFALTPSEQIHMLVDQFHGAQTFHGDSE